MTARPATTALNDAVWTRACTLETFTCFQLMADTGACEDRVRQLLKGWKSTGKIEDGGRGLGRRKIYRTIKVRKRLSLSSATPHGNMWRTMRHSKVFTIMDVQMCANTNEVPVDEDAARKYCHLLVVGDYLRVQQKAVPGRRPAIYQLVKDTGPKPPRPKRISGIWDENNGKFIHGAVQ